MLKKSKLIIALSLFAQSFSFFFLFCVLCAKKKSIASAFLAVAAMGGVTGALLLSRMKRELAEGSTEFDDDIEVDGGDLHDEMTEELFELDGD